MERLGPGNDYTWYVTGHPAGRISSDPLCEVGCTYAVRGFDYDYVGILWLNDLSGATTGVRYAVTTSAGCRSTSTKTRKSSVRPAASTI